ncbi:MAG: LptF/LptG family permease [Firmicutes bacterium]|nr:LptF/LptG family permease [Bacillota bacterium]
MRIIHRYIWKEFIAQFWLCLLGFTALGIGKVFFENNDLFIGYRIPMGLMWLLLLDQIPMLLMDVIPAAALFGLIIAAGRLLRDRELDVIRVCGVSIIKATAPVLLGTLFICIGAYFWNDLVVTSANYRFQTEVRKLSRREDMPLLKENVVFKGPQNRFIYLNKVQNAKRLILGILIIEAGGSGKWPRLISAESGKALQGNWELYNGVVHELDDDGSIKTELAFEKMTLKMSNDYWSMIGEQKGPTEMRASELWRQIMLDKKSGLNNPVYPVYYHQKYADPIISLILVFMAIPLTFFTSRHNSWLGLVWCFLIIMAYYVLQVVGRNLGTSGVIAPWLAAWFPHFLFCGVGILMLTVLEQRR